VANCQNVLDCENCISIVEEVNTIKLVQYKWLAKERWGGEESVDRGRGGEIEKWLMASTVKRSVTKHEEEEREASNS
jgi:hypothetical protein